MNINLIQMDENNGISIDENQIYKVLEKENDKYSFEEILTMENTLEDLEKELDSVIKEEDFTNLIFYIGKAINAMISASLIVADCLLYFFEPSSMSIKGLIIANGFIYTPIKIFKLAIVGTRAGKIREIKELKSEIDDKKQNIFVLKKELCNAKEMTGYKEMPASLKQMKDNYIYVDEDIDDMIKFGCELPEYNLYIDANNDKDKINVKFINLKKDKKSE